MPTPIVYFDIAGPDDETLKSFYNTVFDWEFNKAGQFDAPAITSVTGALTGAIRKDPTEKRIYFGVPDVTATLEHISQAGGSVDVARFEVAGVVVIGLFQDPAGNPMGLIEMDGDQPRVP